LQWRTALRTFIDTPGVESTNNLTERTLRRFVIWRKISFRHAVGAWLAFSQAHHDGDGQLQAVRTQSPRFPGKSGALGAGQHAFASSCLIAW
jgi:hypothetical protein